MNDEILVCAACGFAYRKSEGGCPNPACDANPTLTQAQKDELARRETKRQLDAAERRKAADLWGQSIKSKGKSEPR